MNLLDFLPALAGIGMFLYGMSLMGSSLEKLAGSKLEMLLERLTSSKLRGVLLGAAVTGVIQSSAATTVMLVGFVNAGIMKLTQAIPVIMGANIGTTVTAWLLTLDELTGGAGVMSYLKPATMAPVIIIIGAMMILFTSKKRINNIGGILFGLGILFFGMNTMESTLGQLADLPFIQNAFNTISNPAIGIILGVVVTVALQSSSASVGILQAFSTTGMLRFSAAMPVIFGQNIGTCVTVILAASGANRNAKRTAMVHLFFNMIGTVAFVIVFYGAQYTVGLPFWENTVGKSDIAQFHTFFNLVNTFWMLPFTVVLEKLANMFIKDRKAGLIVEDNLLDDRFISTPGVALNQCKKVTVNMARVALDNYRKTSGMIDGYTKKDREYMIENEAYLDRNETAIANYMVKITSQNLADNYSRIASEVLRAVSDFERIGDYCDNIAEVFEFNSETGITFSDEATEELRVIMTAVDETIALTLKAYEDGDEDAASRVEPLEEVVDMLVETLKSAHIERLQAGICNVQAGISFLELLSNLERISDHCSNVAIYVLRVQDDGHFDPHAEMERLQSGASSDFVEKFNIYAEKYKVEPTVFKDSLRGNTSSLDLLEPLIDEERGRSTHEISDNHDHG